MHIVRTVQSMRGWIVCGSHRVLLCSTGRCLSLSCLTTVRAVVAHRYSRTRPILPWALTCGASEASFFSWEWPFYHCRLNRVQRLRLNLGHQRNAAFTNGGKQLTIALLRAAKRVSTRRRGQEGRLRARIQCPWQRSQPGAPPFSAVRKTHHCHSFCLF